MAQIGVKNFLYTETSFEGTPFYQPTIISYCKYCLPAAIEDAAQAGYKLVETQVGVRQYCKWSEHKEISREGEAQERSQK